MNQLPLHEFHSQLKATFTEVRGAEVVSNYGDVLAEHRALHETAGVLDFSLRSRLCLLGADRIEFLHGQVTNDIKGLSIGTGCYAALVNAKGKMQSDLNIYRLQDELLLDFEPGLTGTVQDRLEKFVVAADVQFVDVAPHYNLLSIQGPRSAELVRKLELGSELPAKEREFRSIDDPTLGQLYVMKHSRLRSNGFDLFMPIASTLPVAERLLAISPKVNGQFCGWDAFEIARVEAGVPRFGIDMDETNLPPEAGLEKDAISYSKGCYIGQEVIARIRTYGQVAKSLRGLLIEGDSSNLPIMGDTLLTNDKDAGYITSAVWSPRLAAIIALGYIRRNIGPETILTVQTRAGGRAARIVPTPFV